MKISLEKRNKIYEQILAFLFQISPQAVFTYNISKELARDEEFIKKLLFEMKKLNLVFEIKKNPKGQPYLKRSRWKLTNEVYIFYKKKQLKEKEIV